MQKMYAFLKACGVFFVLTTQAGQPVGRPFGAVMEYEGTLYISTGVQKDVCRQLRENPAMQIVALKPGTREWLRLSGRARECREGAVREAMLKTCPALKSHFASAADEGFVLFAIDQPQAFLNTDGTFVPVD